MKKFKTSKVNKQKTEHRNNGVKYLPIILILILGAYLRIYRIENLLTFLGDEGRDVLVVYNILHGHLTLLGPTASVGGFFMGPIYYYFMAPFLWLFNYNPVGPAVMVALFGVATIFLVYKISLEFFGKTSAFVASFLYAVSSVVIFYSHSSWNPNLMPFFSLLALYAVYKALNINKKWIFLLCGIFMGIVLQLHYVGLFLGVIIGFYILYINLFNSVLFKQYSKIKAVIESFKEYIIIFIGFLIGWSPFLAFEIRHDFANTKSIFDFIFHSKETGGSMNFFPVIGDVFNRLYSRLLFDYPATTYNNFYNPQIVPVLKIGIVGLALLSVIYLVWRNYQNIIKKAKDYQKYSLLLIWLLLGIFIFGFYKKSIYDYYFEFMFPLPFLILGSVYQNFTKYKLFLKVTLALLFVTIFYVNYVQSPIFMPFNDQLKQAREISRFVLDKTNNKPFNFALISSGNSDHAYRYFFTIWGDEPVTIQNPQIDPKRSSVTNQLLVVCEGAPACEPLGNSLWEIAGFGRAEIEGSWDVSVVKVYKLVPYNNK